MHWNTLNILPRLRRDREYPETFKNILFAIRSGISDTLLASQTSTVCEGWSTERQQTFAKCSFIYWTKKMFTLDLGFYYISNDQYQYQHWKHDTRGSRCRSLLRPQAACFAKTHFNHFASWSSCYHWSAESPLDFHPALLGAQLMHRLFLGGVTQEARVSACIFSSVCVWVRTHSPACYYRKCVCVHLGVLQ